MSAPQLLGLFSSPPRSRQGSGSIVTSVLVHVAIAAWVYFGLKNVPRLAPYTPHRFTVRILNAPPPEPVPPVQPALAHAVHPTTTQMAPASAAPDQLAASMPSVAETLAKLAPKHQILIQPDAPPQLMLEKPVPVPLALRWTPPKEPVKVITPAPTQKSIVATLRPTIEPPNRELKPADFKMTSTKSATLLPSLPPSTTSPIVVRGPDPAKRIPETSSPKIQQAAPVQIMSLSDLRMKEGPTLVPLANALSRPSAASSVGTSAVVSNSTATTGQGTGQHPGTGPAKGTTGELDKSASGTRPGPQTATAEGPASPGADSGTGSADGRTTSAVHLPKDGQFGIVVVGSAIAEQYPESVTIWAGRIVYTVYLHLGHGKAWILQYSLPSNVLAAAGNIRPEAPWPYDVVQPHLDPADYTTDAVMIHGFVNLSGRFERLNVVFPTQFSQSKFVLSALQQWQFRPARQNGQLAQVEVLLIIPEQNE
jgi:hypothetical protein